MLHTLRQSPFQCDITEILRYTQPGDDLLLIEDGVIAALNGSRALELLLSAPITVSALQEDVEARGLSAQISSKIERVGYTDFVRLTIKHSQQFAW
ncbi:sulfurtransferase complex subunit TusB [Cedecea neteri]|uniref:sulfurtransferase complex subunit TusB n=1 Tax=Cedecea neteri TaxID=158822 RepID=UPI0004F71437|nr:sulfurtransferase complex subunit TusB [Cedecea neteri]AIR64169.1 sulfur transfer complex subunit TusB [Cedecea neteri]